MNKSKKLTAAVAASAVASAMVVPAAFAGTTFSDIEGSYAKDAILKLAADGVINGVGNGAFNPTGTIKRQDFAIILAKTLKLDLAASADAATFSDVPKGHYAHAAVEAAVKAGLIKGVGAGAFGEGQDLSRQDLAALFGRALNYVAGKDVVTGKASKLTFSDAADIADYAKDAVGAAFELGYISGSNGKFDPKGTATREQLASMTVRFVEAAEKVKVATLTAAAYTDKNTVSLTFSGAVEKLEAADVKVAVKATSASVNVTGVTLSADKKSATVKTTDLAAGTTFTATVNGVAVEFASPASTVVTASKAEAPSLKQVKVTFSGKIDADSVASGDFSFTNAGVAVPVTSATVLDDNTVLVVLTTPATNQATYKLTVSGVNDVNGTVVEDASFDVAFFDNAVPTVSKVEVTGPHTLKVTFSAPLAVAGGFSLDNGTYSVSAGATSDIDNSVVVNVPANLTEGEHTLKVDGNQVGYNNFKVAASEQKFSFAKDTVAPTATVEKVTLVNEGGLKTRAVIKFSKKVTIPAGTTLYATYNKVAQYAATFTKDGVAQALPQTGDTFEVTFNAVLPTGANNFFLNNASTTTKVADAWGNKFEDQTLTGTLNIDTVKPTVTKVTAENQNTLWVSYSESVVGADNGLNYTIKDKDGKIVAVNGVDGAGHPNVVQWDAAKKAFKIVLGGNLVEGDYSVTVANVKDIAAPTANTLEAATLNFAVVDSTKPTVNPTAYKVVNSTDKITKLFVSFSKPMNTVGAGSITDVNNYRLNGAALPKDSTVASTNNNTTAVITLGTALDNAALTNLTVGAVADSKGMFTASLSTVIGTANILADGIYAGDVINAKLVESKKLTFEVKQPVSAIDATKIRLNGAAVNGAWVELTTVDSGKVNGAVITIDLATAQATDLAAIGNLTIEAGALKNANGAGIQGGTITVLPAAITDKLAATIADDAVVTTGANGNVTGIDVTFSETMKASSIGLGSFTVAGYTVTDVTTADSKTFHITVTPKTFMDSYNTPVVTLVQAAQDSKGNVTAVQTEGVTALDKVAAAVSSQSFTATTVTLTFSESMKASTLVAGNFTIGGVAATAITVSGDNRTVTLTFAAVAAGNVVNYAGLQDAEDNATAGTVTL